MQDVLHDRDWSSAAVASEPSRRLIAVVHLDVVRYSHLVAADPVGAMVAIDRVRDEVVLAGLRRWPGVVVNTAGDSFLLAFSSVHGAVQFAVGAQAAVRAGAGLPAMRIGVGISDAVGDGSSLHGDGVVVTVRLQAACEPGGVCISADVHHHLEPALRQRFRAAGPLRLKHIEGSVEAFHLAVDGVPGAEVAPPDAAPAAELVPRRGRVHSGLPQPTLILLPFGSWDDDPRGAAISRAVTDGVAAALHHTSEVAVVVADGGTTLRPRRLPASYRVNGSLLLQAGRIRVTAFLSRARTGVQLWADSFELGSEFDPMRLDEVCRRIAQRIDGAIGRCEEEVAVLRSDDRLSAYDFYLRARAQTGLLTPETNDAAIKLFSISHRMNPVFSKAAAAAAVSYSIRHDQSWSRDISGDRAEGLRLALAALRQGDHDATVLAWSGHTIASLAGDYETGAELLNRSVGLKHSWAESWMRRAMMCVYRGDPRQAIADAQTALSISPQDRRSFIPLCAIGYAELELADYDRAVHVAKQALALPSKPEMAFRILISALYCLDRQGEMRAVARAFRQRSPHFRISDWRRRMFFTQNSRFDTMATALARAGVPD